MMALVDLLQKRDTERERVYILIMCQPVLNELLRNKCQEFITQNSKNVMQTILINGQMVEIGDDFKYLGTFTDSSLTFKENSEKLCMRALWKASFLLTRPCGAILNNDRRDKMQKIVNMAPKIIGRSQRQLGSVYEELSTSKAHRIINGPSHPLHSEFEL